MIEVKGLHVLTDRLRRLELDHALRAALEHAGSTLQAAVYQRLSEVPGDNHDAPWLRTGRLRDSIASSICETEVVVGSNDPAAAPQECGTRVDPPRPFLAPTAAAEASAIVADIANTAIGALRDTLV